MTGVRKPPDAGIVLHRDVHIRPRAALAKSSSADVRTKHRDVLLRLFDVNGQFLSLIPRGLIGLLPSVALLCGLSPDLHRGTPA